MTYGSPQRHTRESWRRFFSAGCLSWTILVAGCQGPSPESTAKEYAASRSARWLIRADSLRSVKEWMGAPVEGGFYKPLVDSARRLAAPVGDTAAVEIFGRAQALDALDAEMRRADSASLLRDSASMESFRRAALQKLPLVPVVDTLWVVKEHGEWRVWRGDDVNARLDSLRSIMEGIDAQVDGQFVGFADRLAAANAATALLRSPRKLIRERNDDESLLKAISIVRATERNMREHPIKVKVLRASPARVSISIPGLDNDRLFSLNFRVEGTDGAWSTDMNEMLVGSKASEFAPAIDYATPLTIDPVSPPVEIIRYFELDRAKIRAFLGLPH